MARKTIVVEVPDDRPPPKNSGIDPLAVNLPEAARLIGCSENTIRRLINDGLLASCQVYSIQRVRVVDIEAFLERAVRSETIQ